MNKISFEHKLSTLYLKNIRIIWLWILVLSTMLPYLKTSPFSSDIQGHIFISFMLYFLFYVIFYNCLFFSFSSLLVYIVFLVTTFFLHADIFEFIRISFFFLMFYSFISFVPHHVDYVSRIICASVYIYFLFCLLELLFGANISNILVSNARSSYGRGFISLASEPSFLGYVSLSQLVIIHSLNKKKYNPTKIVAIINLFLSGSLAAIIPALFIILFMIRHKLIFIVLTIFLVTIVFFILKENLSHIRIFVLIELLYENPELFLMNDVSILNRLFRSFGPIYISFIDGFSFHTFNSVGQDLARLIPEFKLNEEISGERLSNALTYFTYIYGYLGVSILLTYFYRVFSIKTPKYIIVSILFFSVANLSINTPFTILIYSLPFILVKLEKHEQ